MVINIITAAIRGNGATTYNEIKYIPRSNLDKRREALQIFINC